MTPDANHLTELVEGLNGSKITTILWDADDCLVYVDPNIQDLYSDPQGTKKSKKIDLKPGMSWRAWTEQEIDLGIIEVPEHINRDSFILDLLHERKSIKKTRTREITLKNGITVRSTDVRVKSGGIFSSLIDITSEKEVIDENQWLTKALNNTETHIFVFDQDDKFVFGNKTFIERQESRGFPIYRGMDYLDWYGRLIDKNIFAVPEGLTPEEFLSEIDERRKNLKTQSITETGRTDGTWVLDVTTRLDDGSLVSIVSDLTKQKQQEFALRESSEKISILSNAMDKASNGIMVLDKDDKFVFINSHLTDRAKEAGVNVNVGMHWVDYFRQLVDVGWAEVPDGQTKEQFIEHRTNARLKITHEEATERETAEGTFLLTSSRLDDGGLVTISSDITELKKRELELERLSSAIESISSGVMFFDQDSRLVLANKFARDWQAGLGFELKPGIHRIDMRKNLIQKGLVAESYMAVTKEEYETEKELLSKVGSETQERSLANGFVYLSTDTILADGSTFTVFTDITERKKREETAQRLTEALELISTGIMFWDQDNHLIMANQVARDFQDKHGFKLEPGVHRLDMRKHFIEENLVSSDALPIDKAAFQAEMDQLASQGGQARERKFTDGTVFLFSDTMLADGSTFNVFTDITDTKKREEITQRLTEALELISTGIMFWDADSRLIMANQMARDFQKEHGFDLKPGSNRIDMRRHLVSKGMMSDEDTPIDEEGFMSEMENLKNKHSESREREFTDGTVFLFSDTMLADGSTFNVFTDITERKKREETTRRLLEALEFIPNGMQFWDKDDHLIQANNIARNRWEKYGVEMKEGQSRYEMRDQYVKNNAIIFRGEKSTKDRLSENQKNWDSLAGSRTREIEFAGGEILLFTDTRLGDGSALSFSSDITELKERERDLEAAKIAADEANEAKSQFLANMSHELRTPLNAVIGLTEMLKEDATDDGYDDYLEPLDRIHNSGRHLLTLINDVLDLSKIEAGKIELYIETFSISQLMQDIISTSQPLAQKNNNELILDNELKFDEISADQTRVRQIVLNLVSNACKFSEDGNIRIQLSSTKIEDKKLLEIAVADTGIGMSKEELSRLFQAFTQADSSTTRKYGGTGLGLTITKHLSEMMGGSVGVTSVEGKGTTFTASLIIDTEQPHGTEPDRADIEESGENTRMDNANLNAEHSILIIDDDPTIRELMKRQLERDGFQVIIAKDGKTGISTAIEKRPDAIVLDILMPGMDGWSVLRALKASKETKDIPVIMASILDERNRGFSLGAADYLSKPVEKDRLISSVERLIGAGEGKTIFIVEDDEDLRIAIKEALSKNSYKVLEAENGKAALKKLENTTEQPDLILLDLNMPVMNGFEFLEEYRTNFSTEVPIVVITGADLTEEDKLYLSGEVTRILEKTPDTQGSIAGDVARILRNVHMGSDR